MRSVADLQVGTNFEHEGQLVGTDCKRQLLIEAMQGVFEKSTVKGMRSVGLPLGGPAALPARQDDQGRALVRGYSTSYRTASSCPISRERAQEDLAPDCAACGALTDKLKSSVKNLLRRSMISPQHIRLRREW